MNAPVVLKWEVRTEPKEVLGLVESSSEQRESASRVFSGVNSGRRTSRWFGREETGIDVGKLSWTDDSMTTSYKLREFLA